MITTSVKNLKKTKPIKIRLKKCAYCYYARAMPDDKLCQECRDMINKKCGKFIK